MNSTDDILTLKVLVKENEVPTEKNSSRASIFATKASYISNTPYSQMADTRKKTGA